MESSIIVSFAIGIPAVVALVEVAKRFISDERLYPVASIVLGFLVTFTINQTLDTPYRIWVVILQGLFVGLGASGLYSGVKTVSKPSADEVQDDR